MQDYHIHSYFSGDSESRIEDIIARARDMNIEYFIITDHVDDMQTPFALKDTCKDRTVCRQTMREFGLPTGIEYSWDGVTERTTDLNDFDFAILSYHDEFDIVDGKINYGKYLRELYEIASRIEGYNVLGHLDLPRRYDPSNRKFDRELYPELERLFELLKENGKGIEVNMSAIDMYGDPNPDWDIVKFYHDCGGEIITVGSDAHVARNVGKYISEGLERLKAIGFRYLDVFDKGKWVKKQIP
ncbi:MAG TPA: PHP domain-containing protein [Thermotogota bacterium]|nr:PHP domain-containing protein [Thermotogota bacterium]HPR96351.1 PHP domain-containing protein [Thermotogota bacterium]